MNPKQLIEKAAFNYLSAYPLEEIEEDAVYMGVDNPVTTAAGEDEPETEILPCVTLVAEGDFTEVTPFTNNWRGILTVTVRHHAHDVTDEDFDSICKEAFSRFGVSNLSTFLSSGTEDFHCYQARIVSAGNATRDDAIWTNSIRLDCVFAPADLI